MIKGFIQAQQYLFAHIPQTTSTEFPGERGLARMQELMRLLGNPQERLSIIHIAGTSGKGSTAFLTSIALQSQGLRVGTHLSPHILDIRERCLINNTYLLEEKFVRYLNDLIPAVESVTLSEYGMPTYFEILVALAYYTFEKEQVDVAVIETGLGGTFDGTNVITNPSKISVITAIGKDHTAILGNTLEKIAGQKAGIIHRNNTVISTWQPKSVRSVIDEAVATQQASLVWVKPNTTYHHVKVSPDKTSFTFEHAGHMFSVELGLIGTHQAQNAAVALTVLFTFAQRNKITINSAALQKSLRHAYFAGRMDIKKIGVSSVILDGAHNPQKMKQLLSTLEQIYPAQSFDFLLSFKQGKDARTMMRMIAPHAKTVTFAPFFMRNQDMKHMSQDPAQLAAQMQTFGVGSVNKASTAADGYATALQTKPSVLVVTGSLYFLSEVYSLLPVTHS